MVISQYGIVAAEHPIAARAGTAMLESGGNAIDAAVAANAAMGLVAPMMNGIGGDLFAIVYDAKSKKIYGLDASGWAPKALTPEFLPPRASHTCPIAGSIRRPCPAPSPAGMRCCSGSARKPSPTCLLRRSSMPRPASRSARSSRDDWDGSADDLLTNPEAAKVFLPGGACRGREKCSAIPISPASLEAIAQGGSDAFYKGAIARRILATSAKLGGTMTADDLADFAAEWVEPISTEYRGWTVYEMPPSEQGIAALMMLNIMSASPIKQWGHNSVRGPAHGDRGQEARLCRHDPLCRRPPLRQGAGEGDDLGRIRPRARQAHRSGQGQLRGRPRHTALQGFATRPIFPPSIATATWCR